MEWTDFDKGTICQCEEAIQRCEKYHIAPAPWFPLCLRMHQALENAGMLEKTKTGQPTETKEAASDEEA